MIISNVRHRYLEILIAWGIIALAINLASGQSPVVACLDIALVVFLCVLLWMQRHPREDPKQSTTGADTPE